MEDRWVYKPGLEGYLTVEASILFPIILFFLISLFQIAIFQYDRCLMEQNLAVVALRGSLMNVDTQAQEAAILAAEQELYTEQMIGFLNTSFGYRIAKGTVMVQKSGKLLLPTAFSSAINRTYKIAKPDPVTIGRWVRKLRVKKEDTT